MSTTTAAPFPPQYNCDFVRQLPFEGAEILIVSAIFLFIVVNFAVSYFAVVAKQLWPSALDPVVANRVYAIQKMFPNLVGSSDDESNTSAVDEENNNKTGAVPVKTHTVTDAETGEPIKYDSCVAAEAYIAGKSVDEDLLFVLANNNAFGTVSSYSTCTVRGFVMLSTMLMTCGMCLAYMWLHNVIVDPSQNTWLGKIALIGYCMCFLTGVTMCGPTTHAVFRNANIWLTTNVPLSGTPKKMLDLHGVGIVSFCLLPMLSHLLYALFNKDKMPNYHETMAGIGMQLFGAILFGLCNILPGKVPGFTNLLGNKYGIAAECVAVLASCLAFINYEYYATATCAGQVSYYNTLLMGAMIAPFALVAKHFCWAPTSFTTLPSMLLCYQGQPVAQVGPSPVEAFNGSTFNPDGVSAEEIEQRNKVFKQLPSIKMNPEDFKM